nr:pentatricopeptide repeat-containing protein At1g71420 [Ipomoea batatas]
MVCTRMLQPRPITTHFRPLLQTLTTTGFTAAAELNTILERLRVGPTRSHLNEALSIFYSPNSSPSHSPKSYAILFHACARLGCVDVGQALHQHMLTHNPIAIQDLYTANHLLNLYSKSGQLDCAHQLFDEMCRRNIVSWTSLISGYAQSGKADACFSLFSNMLAHYKPTDFAYASVLSVCDGLRGKQVHALALKTGYNVFVYVGNALIGMYTKNSEISVYSDENEAWRVFNDMEFRNIVSWNAMIAGFQMSGQGDKAMKFFTMMHSDGLGFDRATLVTVLSLLSSQCDLSWSLKFCSQLHCVTLKTGFVLDVEVVTALIKAYSFLEGNIGDCYNLFLEVRGHEDIVLWTEIMATFSETEPEQALFLFSQLHTEGLIPDSYAFSVALKACAGFVTERHASVVHCQVIKAGFVDTLVLENALIHAYGRCGSIAQARQVFGEMRLKDVVSWNSMLKAYAFHGEPDEALKLFESIDVEPDATTFVALLSACSHAGMVEEGTRIFNSICGKHRIAPQLDHYACMVDLLGRAGQIFRAEEIIRQMPMKPDSVVWSALLAACRKHGEYQLATIAASKLNELDSGNSLGYVVMSNAYFSLNNFDEAHLTRKQMKWLGVRKEPGLSWTEIGGRVHEFASGGQQHDLGEAIRTNLLDLVKQLKKLGYTPLTSLVLHDIEEEHKEEQLYFHSEKLALMFILMNAKDPHCKSGVVRIMKNIRICLDCHNFMKLASQLVQKQIIVRDSNRFHHFLGGICSCNDYW